ncbi:hypothetical protein CKAH01_00366 [Colletotrichum kahawae]|uniref:Uncharacterized protein n=1 Tax=Colletotrichum kahawae TaxID=34407 RepID=A0AAD9YUX9_COLKA|nr:hypothetical protein CKAH01_00366 [Colletotrichum kahawae]
MATENFTTKPSALFTLKIPDCENLKPCLLGALCPDDVLRVQFVLPEQMFWTARNGFDSGSVLKLAHV